MKRTILAVALAIIFVMALAVPAFAQMTHTKTVEADGVYDWETQAGHTCNTGGQLQQTIMGSGELSKVMATAQIPGRLVVNDVNDFVAGETALTITSTIELCAPPKFTYSDNLQVVDGLGGVSTQNITAPVHPLAMYTTENIPAVWGTGPAANALMNGVNISNLADHWGWEAVSDQIWAAQVQADPGFSGSLHQDFTAAEGPFWGGQFWDPEDAWTNNENRWRWEIDGGEISAVQGDNYVGSFFDMTQHARTSMGEVRRFIDISSPWTHGYVYEDMEIVGKSDIQESFNMTNLGPGGEVPGLWYDLF